MPVEEKYKKLQNPSSSHLKITWFNATDQNLSWPFTPLRNARHRETMLQKFSGTERLGVQKLIENVICGRLLYGFDWNRIEIFQEAKIREMKYLYGAFT